jgi:Response regulator containing CheY-like receiver domain and AraC-type DNA-binding domain
MVDKGSGVERRQHNRAPMMLKVATRDTPTLLNVFTENVSQGGVFIVTSEQFSIGEEVDFEISFPGLLDPIPMKGQVKWSRKALSLDEPAGIGVEFLSTHSSGESSFAKLVSDIGSAGGQREEISEIVFRVLLVEDNAVVRDMFRYGVEKISLRQRAVKARVEVEEAGDGKEAWTMLKSRPFHLMILDLYMPVMDGAQLIEMVRNDEHLKDLIILVVSAGGAEGKDMAKLHGADAYLDKPIKLKDMTETIATLLAIGQRPKR